MEVVVGRISDLPADALAPLVAESEREGWRFVRRLADEWAAGANRFDRPGEALFAARAVRGRGIGSRLVGAVVRAAPGRFRLLRVRTENPEAGRLYERLGFTPVTGVPDCTHVLTLGA